MADLSITAASVVADPSASRVAGQAGEAIAAGKAVYLHPTSKKWMLADSDAATAAARKAGGIALNGAALNQPVTVATHGDVTIGATLIAGSTYFLSETPGGIQPAADLGTGENVCMLGIARSTTVLALSIQTPGVVI